MLIWNPVPSTVGTPTIFVILPFESISGNTFAPMNGAYPLPGVDPADIIIPPLGNWFSLTSPMSIIGVVNPSELTPVNCTELIPACSIILKLALGLFSLNGAWNILLMNNTPLPPVVPIPVTAAPVDVNG